MPKGYTFEASTKKRIISRYMTSEETIAQIAKMFHVDARTIQRIVADAGRAYSRQRPPFTEGELAWMSREYRRGSTCAQIARAVGAHEMSVRRTLRDRGVRMRRGRAAHAKRFGIPRPPDTLRGSLDGGQGTPQEGTGRKADEQTQRRVV